MKSITFKLDDGAFLPKKGTSLSAGYDIHALKEVQVEPNSRKLIETGVYLRDMPSDLYIRIAPRSGLAVKKSIDIGAGVVDSDYRGEIRVLFINNGLEPYHINCHDRIAQLMGNGLLTFIHKDTKYNDFFDNNEIIFYKNVFDLSEKIKKYQRDKKKSITIARNGHAKYHKFFNSSVVSNFIIDKIYGVNNIYYWEK